jgi:hypothetical protein
MRSKGWNTWDVRCPNGMVHLPDGLEVRFALAHDDVRKSEFRWPDVVRLGRHAPNGEYCEITVRSGPVVARLEFASAGETLIGRATPAGSGCGDAGIGIEVLFPWSLAEPPVTAKQTSPDSGSGSCRVGEGSAPREPPHSSAGGSCRVGEGLTPRERLAESGVDGLRVAGTGGDWHVRPAIGSGRSGEAATFVCHDGIWVLDLPFTEAAAFCAARDDVRMTAAEIDSRLRTAHAEYVARSPVVSGVPASCLEGIEAAIMWNTFWAPSAGKIVTVVSRDWCVDGNYGEYILFPWDTFFAALLAAVHDVDLARTIVDAQLDEATERGFMPNCGCEIGKSRDRSQPPFGAYCVLKLHRRHPDRDALARWFPKLLRWHDWWFTARDGNGDGLLEWGSDDIPNPHPQWQSHTLQAARYESGLDNSPIYDDAVFNETANTMEMADVGLNSLYVLDAWSLAEMADILGETEARDRLRAEWQAMGERINAHLWDEDRGLYQNRHWDGRWCGRIAATSFYPLLAGIVPDDRAKRLVAEHLLNPAEFWGESVIPSISRDDPAYRDQAYWRGRIWGPMNFLVYEGLRRAGFREAAHEVADKSVRLFRGEWEGEGHIHENYNADTGDGDDVRYSEPVYHWGALLAYIGLEEAADLESGESAAGQDGHQ